MAPDQYTTTGTTHPDGATTTVLPTVGSSPGPANDLGDRLAEARTRVAHLDTETKLAWAGAALTTLAFLLLPYSRNGTAVEAGGRFWWRPILAIAAAALVTAAARRYDLTGSRLAIASLAVGAAAATEAGLFGLVSRGSANLRIGFFVMLVGALLVAFAAARSALRRCPA